MTSKKKLRKKIRRLERELETYRNMPGDRYVLPEEVVIDGMTMNLAPPLRDAGLATFRRSVTFGDYPGEQA